MIAALFVDAKGPYAGLDGVDAWDEARDARTYAGPHSVVAHPPCQRWGRYWYGGPSIKVRLQKGDDGGCFQSALDSVRRYGGVLEHPEASAAWDHFGLKKPPRGGGWVVADEYGFTCCVEQGHYGHRARKATWLYAVGCELPELIWGPSSAAAKLEDGCYSAEDRKRRRAEGRLIKAEDRLTPAERIHTPVPFRDMLVAMANSVSERGYEYQEFRLLNDEDILVI